jgi:hypothetical protein
VSSAAPPSPRVELRDGQRVPGRSARGVEHHGALEVNDRLARAPPAEQTYAQHALGPRLRRRDGARLRVRELGLVVAPLELVGVTHEDPRRRARRQELRGALEGLARRDRARGRHARATEREPCAGLARVLSRDALEDLHRELDLALVERVPGPVDRRPRSPAAPRA